MCPGTVSSQGDVLSDWMLEAGLALAEYPVLAYDLLPLDGEVSQWKHDGRAHFLDKFPNVKQATAAATRYPTVPVKHWVSHHGSIRNTTCLYVNSSLQTWQPVAGGIEYFLTRRVKEIADFMRVSDILFVGLLKPEARHVNTTYCPAS